MRVVVLAGGMGSRLAEETQVRPKPLVEVGGRPILWHILKHYAAAGHDEFIVALGYKGEEIKRYFLEYPQISPDMTVRLGQNEVIPHQRPTDRWVVHLVDTGLHTNTGGRVRRLRTWLNDTFMLTYGDGVSNVDIQALLAFHRAHGKLATVTAVRPPARFGGLEMEGDQVVRFSEKRPGGEAWINGGFMVLEPGVLDHLEADEDSLEIRALERVAAAGELMAFRHEGFWQCMDTIRDRTYLQDLWSRGDAPWQTWSER